jgi:hypothetical protein
MAERFQKLLQNPEMRNNFVMTNIYIDVENQGKEIEFKLKNTDVDENSKSYRIAFLEGLNSPNAEVKSFFEDLGMGSYLQYAGSFASGHVSTIVPHEVYVSYTTNAFNKLTELKDTDSPKFEAYLSLVRFSTKMALETAGPIKGSSTFFVDNYGEMAKTITGLSPEVLKVYKNRENLTSGKVEPVQQSTAVNSLVEAGVKPTDMAGNAAKDIQMASESTQFIGFQSGTATVSSTNKYKEAWGNKANTGNYTANDVVMVSGSGLFRGVTEAQIKETLTNQYKPLLEQAIAAGASFRVGNQYAKGNLSDQLIAQYLKTKGYQEEKFDGYSRWTPEVTETSQQTQAEVIENFEEDSDVTDTNVPNTPTQFPPTKTDAIQLTLKLDPDQKDDDKGNLDDLGFEEDTCEIV